MSRISVVGLGKLGACTAACFAAKGHEVVGVDIDPEVVRKVAKGEPPVVEPGLAETMAKAGHRLRATTSYDDAVTATDSTFIVVPTPSDGTGAFSLDYVLEAGAAVGSALRNKKDYHLVVLVSTVLPGATEFGLKAVLEKTSGKACGRDFGLCYNPEFIALGSVIKNFLNPDFVLIGESDALAGERLQRLYATTCENNPPASRMNFVNAELAKIALNTYVTTKITFANLLAEACERIPNADVDVVTRALGQDSRIGGKYLKGGLGYGGPCFPRDNIAFARFLEGLGVPSDLPRVVHEQNQRHAARIADRALRIIQKRPGRVTVLGLAYKPDTPVVEASAGLEIARRLAEAGANVTVWDPLAMGAARRVLGEKVHYAADLSAAVAEAACIVVATPSQEFLRLPFPPNRPPVILDAWRTLRGAASGQLPAYHAVGLPDPDVAAWGAKGPLGPSAPWPMLPVSNKATDRRARPGRPELGA